MLKLARWLQTVYQSFPSLSNESHPSFYFLFFKRLIGKLKLVLYGAVGRKEMCGHLSLGHCFGPKMISEATLEHLNF